MQTLCILSNEQLFAESIQLELEDSNITVLIWSGHGALPKADTYLWDIDSILDLPEVEGRVICTTWDKEKPQDYIGSWLDRPFRPARLKAVLGLYGAEKTRPGVYPIHERRSVLVGGQEIKLTSAEFRLFCCLYDAKGEYISRSKLHQEIWNGEGDEGIVNVYIHYLRQKLESGGHKLFHSARGRGYAYLEKGEELCSN